MKFVGVLVAVMSVTAVGAASAGPVVRAATGPNAASILAGITRPDQGDVRLSDAPFDHVPPELGHTGVGLGVSWFERNEDILPRCQEQGHLGKR